MGACYFGEEVRGVGFIGGTLDLLDFLCVGPLRPLELGHKKNRRVVKSKGDYLYLVVG